MSELGPFSIVLPAFGSAMGEGSAAAVTRMDVSKSSNPTRGDIENGIVIHQSPKYQSTSCKRVDLRQEPGPPGRVTEPFRFPVVERDSPTCSHRQVHLLRWAGQHLSGPWSQWHTGPREPAYLVTRVVFTMEETKGAKLSCLEFMTQCLNPKP